MEEGLSKERIKSLLSVAPGTGPRKVWCHAYVNELKEAELLVLHTLIRYPGFAKPLHCTGLVSPGRDCIFAKLENNIECLH